MPPNGYWNRNIFARERYFPAARKKSSIDGLKIIYLVNTVMYSCFPALDSQPKVPFPPKGKSHWTLGGMRVRVIPVTVTPIMLA